MSRIVRFHETGGPDVLRLDEVPAPKPGPGEVLIRTRALGLNRAESMFRLGQYGVDPVFPAAVSYDAAGVVEGIGDGVDGLEVGDAVSVVPSFSMVGYGMHGELVLAPEHAVVTHPKELSFEHVTSWPKPVQRPYPPILVAGNGPRVAERVIAYGQAWNASSSGSARRTPRG